MVIMKKEEPNTQLFFNNTITRVVFACDKERKVYWVNCEDLHHLFHQYHFLHSFYFRYLLHLPIEEWRIENNFPLQPRDWTTEQWTQFKLRWL
jgi:hypothetical protein